MYPRQPSSRQIRPNDFQTPEYCCPPAGCTCLPDHQTLKRAYKRRTGTHWMIFNRSSGCFGRQGMSKNEVASQRDTHAPKRSSD